MALAFFDLDGTLTWADTFVPYCILSLLNQPRRVFALKNLSKECLGFFRGRIPRQRLKEAFLFTFLRGARRKDIDRWNRVFFLLLLPRIVRKDMLKKVLQHQQARDQLYVVSASPDIYVKPLAKKWAFDGAICTNLERQDGRLTGRILGNNCRAGEKAIRIRALFSEKELEGSFAYGNSEDDREMFEIVGHCEKV